MSQSNNNTSHKPIVLIDLDDTLYPKSSGVHHLVYLEIVRYLKDKLGIQDAHKESVHLYTNHGTTLNGLIKQGYNVDPIHFYHTVHDVPIDGITKDDTKLQALLKQLQDHVHLSVLTNSDEKHMKRLLAHMNITNYFQSFTFYEAMKGFCKPNPEAFHIALERTGFPADTKQPIYFIDDGRANVKSAKKLGWHSIFVQESMETAAEMQALGIPTIRNILELHSVAPELFKE